MNRRRYATVGHMHAPLITALLLLTMITPSSSSGHNITAILEADSRFSSFNHQLTATGLADLINDCLAELTVCALDNHAMAELLALNPSPSSLKRMLLVHIFTSYSDLHFLRTSCCAWTLFPRPSGVGYEVLDFYNTGDGKVSFAFPYFTHHPHFLGFVKELPPTLSIIHVSKVLPSPEFWSLISPIDTLKIMSGAGCGSFAESLQGVAVAEKWFRENAYVGMTVLCPVDAAWERFLPTFRSLDEEQRADLLLFHGIPVYHARCFMRDGAMGDDWPSTLASYKRGNGGNGEPKVNMSAVGKWIVGVGYDDQGPLAVYPIKGVLLPDQEDYIYFDGDVESLELTSITPVPTDDECGIFMFHMPAPAPQPSAPDADLEVEDN